MIWLVNRGSWLTNIAQVNNTPSKFGIISADAHLSIVPSVRHDLALYSYPAQALFGTTQPCPNRRLDMVDGHEGIALTCILYLAFAYTGLSGA